MKKLNKKGVASLNIFLGVIVMLFMIGLIVMVFNVASDKLITTTGYSTSGTISQNDINLSVSGVLTTCAASSTGLHTADILTLINSSNGATITDYSVSICTLTNTTAIDLNTDLWNTTYNYQYYNDVSGIINNTRTAISESTDWFGTFIVLAALVVLILMVVLIVTSIRGTGYVGGNTGSMSRNKESA